MLSKLINPFLSKVVDIEHDEFKKVILLQLTIFLIISVLMILKPFGTSLMLNAYGINIMPIAFISIAVAAVFIHFALILLRRSFSLINAIKINFLFHVSLISAMAVAMFFDYLTGWLTVAVYVYISLFSVITVTLFFQYCQSLLSISEAKRVLSSVGVGAIGGGVFGGYFASAAVSNFGNIGLLFSAVAFLIFAALSLSKVHKEFGPDLMNGNTNSEWIGGQFFRTLKNKHVAYIVGITCFGVIASKLLDYLFNAVAYSHFADRDTLTAFFGFWFSSINLIGLIIQLFVVKVLIDRLGVTYSMSIMPVMILGSLVAFLYFPVLAVGIIMKMVDGSMKQSIYKTSTEINIMPLSSGLRERAKSLVDVVVDSIATGLSGILIFILINKVSLPFSVIAIATILIVIAWITFIILSRKTYLRQLSYLVYADDDEDEDLTISPREYLEHILKGSPRKSSIRLNKLVRLTKDAKVPIRSAAIETTSEEYKVQGITQLDHLRKDKSYIVRKKYFEEKLKYINSKSDLKALYETTAIDNQIILTGALARSIGHRRRLQEKYQVNKRIKQAYKSLCQNELKPKLWRTWMTAVAHSRSDEYYPIIKEHLSLSANADMKMYALFAVMQGKLKILYPDVLKCQVNSHNRKRWYKALAIFPNKLLSHIKSLPKSESKKLKKLIPAFKHIDKQSHLDFLFTILDHPNRGVRIETLKIIGVMKRNYPYLNYSRRRNRVRLRKIINQIKEISGEINLMNALIIKSQKSSDDTEIIKISNVLLKNERSVYIHIMFVIMGLILDSEEMMKCYYGIVRGREEETLDYLDQLLPYRLKKQVLPVLRMATTIELNADIHLNYDHIKNSDIIAPHLKRINPYLFESVKKLTTA